MTWQFKISAAIIIALFISSPSLFAQVEEGITESAKEERTRLKVEKVETFEQKIEELVRPYMDLESSVGLIIGILDENNVGFKPFGSISKKDSIAPTKQSLYEIGSMSKIFTSLVFLLMEEEGQIDRSDAISQFIPKKVLSPYLIKNEITIDDLLRHRSGFPKFPYNMPFYKKNLKNPYAEYDELALEEFLINFELEEDAKKEFGYSHFNIALLGYILEKASNQSFESLLHQKINENLGLTSIQIANSDSENLALAYSEKGKALPTQKYKAMTPAAGLSSNAEDLLKLMKLSTIQFNSGEQNAITKSLEEIGKTLQPGVSVSPAWQVFKTGKGNKLTYTYNSGMFGGNRCFIAFVPAIEKGVVVLANNKLNYKDENSVDMIGIEILNIISR